MSFAVSPVPWFGGKQKLAARIASLLPEHESYVEAFGGGGAVLFVKRPATLEVYNDVDGGLVHFFRVLRDDGDELQRRLKLTLYSRQEWNEARPSWEDAADPIERARLWFVTIAQAYAAQAFSSEGVAGGWGGERLGRMHQARCVTWSERAERLHAYARRMHRVQIEHLDWRAMLERYDAPGACFYLDPPYLPDVRRSGGYRHELTAEDHVDLIARVRELHGSVLLSGYDSPLYRDLEEHGFTRHEFPAICTAQSRFEGRERTEIVWRRVHDDGRLFA